MIKQTKLRNLCQKAHFVGDIHRTVLDIRNPNFGFALVIFTFRANCTFISFLSLLKCYNAKGLTCNDKRIIKRSNFDKLCVMLFTFRRGSGIRLLKILMLKLSYHFLRGLSEDAFTEKSFVKFSC